MKKLSRVLLATIALSLILGSTGFAAPKKLNIVFVTPLVAHPVWDFARAGFYKAAGDLGFNAQYVGPLTIDPTEMVNQIELAIVQKVDGIITMPISPTAMRPVLRKAAQAKIPVVFVGAEDPESPSLAFVGTNEAELARRGSIPIKNYFAGKPIRSIIMISTLDASFAINVRDGYLKAMADYPDFKNVLVETCNSDQQIAMQKYEAAFKAYPEINLVIGGCAEAAPAATKVIMEQKLQGKIIAIGADDVAEAIQQIKDKALWGTMAQGLWRMGNLGSKILVDYLTTGKKPATYKNDSGSVFVDLSNVDTYRADFNK
jgi:ribose transport system substrate-binding protein